MVALVALLSLAGIFAVSTLDAGREVLAGVALPPAPVLAMAAPAREPQMPATRVFRHSVVPGGVFSAEEVKAAIGRDAIVAAHYSAVNAAGLRVETLAQGQLVYMSYRIGDDVFWTKQKVRLQQGESILTDGAHRIRTRCGNCISLTPMEPTAEDEPGEMEFDAVEDEPRLIASHAPFGSELLFGPIGSIPLPWLMGSPDGFAQNGPTGWESTSVPVFGFAGDPADGDLPPEQFFVANPPSVGLPPPFDGPFTDPPPSNGRDPRDPGTPPGPDNPKPDDPKPGDPNDPSLPENPPVPVPEPGTLLLIGGGLTTAFARKRGSFLLSLIQNGARRARRM